MNNKELQAIYENLYANITKILNNLEFVSCLKSNNSLIDVVLDQISILSFIEKKLEFDSNENSNSLQYGSIECLNNLKTIKKDLEIKEKSFEKIEEINDAINYLNIFMKNNFGKSIDYYFCDSQKNTQEENEEKKSENFDFEKNSNFSNGSANNGFYGGFGQTRVSPESFKETYLFTVASQRLNQDITSGIFYKYKTKPKSILIIKKIMAILFWVISLIGLVGIIVSWTLIDLKIPNSTTGSTQTPSTPEYSTPFNANLNTFETLFNIMYMFIYGYIGWLLFRKEKNENKKYEFQKVIVLILTVFVVFQLFNFIWGIIGQWQIIKELETTYSDLNSPDLINSFKIYVYVGITQTVLYGFLIFVVILALVNSPKVDSQRINSKIKEYADELRKQV